jgi:hypothetical protein
MTRELRPPEDATEQYGAIVRCYRDGSGNVAVSTDPRDIWVTGPRDTLMGRVRDSKAERAALSLINDAEHERGKIQAMRQEQRQFKADKEAFEQERADFYQGLLGTAIRKMESIAARMDALEAEATKAEQQQFMDQFPADPDEPFATFHPTGDLHTLPPSSGSPVDAATAPSAGDLPTDPPVFDIDDPSTWPAEDDDQGLTAVTATRPVIDPADLAYPQPYSSPSQPNSPVAVSLMEE